MSHKHMPAVLTSLSTSLLTAMCLTAGCGKTVEDHRNAPSNGSTSSLNSVGGQAMAVTNTTGTVTGTGTGTSTAMATVSPTVDVTCLETQIANQIASEKTLDASSNTLDLSAAVAACQPQAALGLVGVSDLLCIEGRTIQYFIERTVVDRCYQASLPPSASFFKPVIVYGDANVLCEGTDGLYHEAVNAIAWGCVNPY